MGERQYTGEMTEVISSFQATILFITGERKVTLPKVIIYFILVVGNSTAQLILSPSDWLYLNKGQGNIWLNTTAGSYSVWRQIY
jgi:hypothetical protein